MAKKPNKELGGTRNMSTGTKVLIGIFAVLMAVSMMLPSLAPIFASDTAVETSEEETEDKDESKDTEDEKTTEDEKKEETDIPEVPDNETLKSLSDQYGTSVKKYDERLEKDPNNLAALLNLGQTYMSWGSSATYSSTTDEEKAYSEALLNKSLEYFDRYLDLNDSDAVKVQRAVCVSYAGKTDEAIEALTALTEEKPDYPIAWSSLGAVYEQQYEYDKAIECYTKAQETDPDNEYGARDNAKERLAAINSQRSSFEDLTNQDVLGTNAKPEDGLAGAIANNTDVH